MYSSSTLQWLSLVGIIWLQSISGTNTNFPAYSSEFKNLLSLSQIQLNNLAFASDAGKLFGWLSGVATLYLPLWFVLMIGAVLGLIGYGVQFLFLVNKIAFLSYCQIFFLTVLAGNSICWLNTVCYAIAIKNFPYTRQIAVGLSSSYVGLSAKIYTDIVDVVSPGHSNKRAKTYLLLNSVLPLMVSMLAAPILKDIKVKKTKGSGRGFMAMFIITIFTGTYAVISSLGLLDMVRPLFHGISLVLLLATPLVIPFASMLKEVFMNKIMESRVHDLTVDEERGESHEEKVDDEEINVTKVMEEIGVKLMLRRVQFWIYFFVYMFGATLGMVYLNNLGQIAESRGYSKTSTLVSLSSSFCFFGRLMPALLHYFFSKSKYMVSRTGSIAILTTLMAGAFYLLLDKHNISLYISTAIIGVCTGAITSFAVSTTSELFGTKNFNVNHNILVVNIPIGSFCFGYLAAVLYQIEALKHGGNTKCMGHDCYYNTFLIWGTICTVGTLLSYILYYRTRRFYRLSV
ncbi:Nuclear fusion defective [Thalictrum thalictroides]|uniref:Nuclear fusion defective n=1 Tax=Thalictrum thalictroides TaxID=46969 RepID=A0A7J6VLV8_THATH|nr:Nuclear fusion defective [Thalictrum thalictroides]